LEFVVQLEKSNVGSFDYDLSTAASGTTIQLSAVLTEDMMIQGLRGAQSVLQLEVPEEKKASQKKKCFTPITRGGFMCDLLPSTGRPHGCQNYIITRR